MTEGVSVQLCPDGPVLVRGARTVIDEAGREHEVTRPVVAVCVCAKSARKPWCDGTHKSITGRATKAVGSAGERLEAGS